MITTYAKAGFEVGLAEFPTNTDTGVSKTMMNGLADSINVNTNDPEGSAEWVAFMATDQCQSVIGEQGVVFPSRKDATPIATEAYSKLGLDTAAFSDPVTRNDVVYFPITDYGADIGALTTPAFEDIYANRKPASTLSAVNDSINILFETSAD